MTAAQLPEPGALLAGRYRIVRSIGEGGMGAVLEAENTVTQKRVAIKILNPELAGNSEAAQRLVREAQASCRVRHQNVVDVYDVASEGDSLFLIMELLEGEPLSALLERGGTPAHEFISLVLSAMRGVAAAHRVGVVHRDIHPGNIFLAGEAPSALLVPKVLDFGISKIRNDHQRGLTGSGVAMGTPLYMSYEQLCSARDIDARTDIYSFGVILYQGLTGQLPFEATVLTELLIKLATTSAVPPKQLYPEIPATLDRLILWAMERERDSRIQSMQAFIDELEPFASERAFRSQMTDAQRTLPSIVPRASSEPPVLAHVAARASQEPESSPASASDPPVRASDAPGKNAAATDKGVVSALRRAQPQRFRLLPAVFVAAATLALLVAGTHLMQRSSRASEHVRRVALPPPLPFLDGGLFAPAAPRRSGRDQATIERMTGLAPSAEHIADAGGVHAPVVEAERSPSPAADSRRPRASDSASAGAPKSKALTTVTKAAPTVRRFRAGEARRRDFLQ